MPRTLAIGPWVYAAQDEGLTRTCAPKAILWHKENGAGTLCEIAREAFEPVESPGSTLLILPLLRSTERA